MKIKVSSTLYNLSTFNGYILSLFNNNSTYDSFAKSNICGFMLGVIWGCFNIFVDAFLGSAFLYALFMFLTLASTLTFPNFPFVNDLSTEGIFQLSFFYVSEMFFFLINAVIILVIVIVMCLTILGIFYIMYKLLKYVYSKFFSKYNATAFYKKMKNIKNKFCLNITFYND